MTWVDDVVAVYGQPKLHGGPVTLRDEGNVPYRKTYWCWFPANRNHHIAIIEHRIVGSTDTYWEIQMGSHLRSMPRIEYTAYAEPTDELMRTLMGLVGFLSTTEAVTA